MPLPELLQMNRIINPSCAAAYGGGTKLKKSSFAPAVRAFHLNRLPRFNTAFSGSICAYCGNEIGRRSMRIDHVIPMRIYCRYKMLIDPQVGTAARLDNTAKLNRIADDYFGDPQNLLLACQNCNGIKKETMPDKNAFGVDETWLELAEENLPHQEKQEMIARLDGVCFSIDSLSGALRNFVLNGTTANTSKMNTRSRTLTLTRNRKRNRDTDVTPHKWLAIQRTLIDRLGASRPDHGYSNWFLELTQAPAGPGPNRDLRVCLYCLGLFMDQAFQLDHIRPVNRSRTTAAVSKNVYNDPRNIVAVCGSCNGSKSNARVGRAWMKDRFEWRRIEGLPGLDTVLSAQQLTQAKAKRDELLGLA